MSKSLRAGLLALAAAVLVAAFLLLRPADDPPPVPAAATTTPQPTAAATEAAGAATPAVTATPSPTATPNPGPLLTTAGVRKIRVRKGQTVHFRVRSSKAEEIHVHGYDLTRDVEPGQTVRMTFKATIDGIFEIELEHSATQIAELRVDP